MRVGFIDKRVVNRNSIPFRQSIETRTAESRETLSEIVVELILFRKREVLNV